MKGLRGCVEGVKGLVEGVMGCVEGVEGLKGRNRGTAWHGGLGTRWVGVSGSWDGDGGRGGEAVVVGGGVVVGLEKNVPGLVGWVPLLLLLCCCCCCSRLR